MLICDFDIVARLDRAALETANLAVLGGTADRVDVDIGNLKLRGGAVSGATATFERGALRNREGCAAATFEMDV